MDDIDKLPVIISKHLFYAGGTTTPVEKEPQLGSLPVEDDCACPGPAVGKSQFLSRRDKMMLAGWGVEDDCAPITSPVGKRDTIPLSHRARGENVAVEHDCAPMTSPVVEGSIDLSSLGNYDPATTYGIAPALFVDRLDQDFYFAFNPSSQEGVVAFNQVTFDLVNGFQQPRTLADGLSRVGLSPDRLDAAKNLVYLGILKAVGQQSKPKQGQSDTLTAWLHVTNACNLDCPYCYIRKTREAMSADIGQQAVEAVFRSAIAHGFQRVKLKYAGGEATLNFHLVLRLHQYAQRLANQYDLELDGVVLSNGVALSSQMIEELKRHQIRLMISLDGVGEQHDIQRPFVNGRGSFAQVERTLDRLAAHDFIPSISITVSNRNLSGLPEVVDYVLERELPFTINFYRENECSASFADLSYQEDQIISAMKAAFTVIEANLPPYSLLGTLVDRARLDVPHDRPCGVGGSYMVINHRGGVGKCHMEMERTITDVSTTDPLQLIRADQMGLQNPSVEEKEGCRDCTWRYWCAGGCPALTYRVTGRFDVKSPNCRIYKALFPEVLRLEALRLLKYSGAIPA